MAQPTPSDVHVNAPLTNVSIAYMQDQTDFIADKAFPGIPVKKQSDRYYSYDKGNWFRAKAQRRLFPLVEHSYAPEDSNGFAITAAETAIKKNIQHLHELLLGETLQLGDDELERTWLLFVETWREGQLAVAMGSKNGGVDPWMNGQCQAHEDPDTGAKLDDQHKIEQDPNYVLRSWMAVVSYLMQDAKFLHQ